MTARLSAHLSEEALNDVLIGLSPPASDAHLEQCEFCRGQLQSFRSEMRVFNQASLAWSAARPSRSYRAAPKTQARRVISAPVSWALATVILLMIAIPAWNRNHRASRNSQAGTAASSALSETQIAEDNDLLRSVNAVLSVNEESPISEYHLSGGPRPHRQARPEMRNR
jgi:predicted anti-sigma-YlaC factor YlaD